jgi:hypothetical protein
LDREGEELKKKVLWGRKRQEIERLKKRVEDLESIICPCGQHEWVRANTYQIGPLGIKEYTHTCRKCGKKLIDGYYISYC